MTDRRTDPRTSDPRVRAIAARVRGGHDVGVLDLSRTGALVAGARPLRPGALIDVHLTTGGHRVILTARVVRCLVAALHPDEGITYHAGLSFEESLDWAGATNGQWEIEAVRAVSAAGHALTSSHAR